jgi:translation initiation factor IF-2
MNSITVQSLARKAGLSTEDLLKKISEAGLPMSREDDTLDIEQQKKVIDHIRSNKKKIGIKLKKTLSLKRKSEAENTIITDGYQHKRQLDRKPDPSKMETPEQIQAELTSTTSKTEETQKKHNKNTHQVSKKQHNSEPASKPLSVEEVLASRSKKNAKKASSETVKPTQTVQSEPQQRNEEKKTLALPETMSIEELSKKINRSTTEIIKMFFELGEMVTINQTIGYDLAEVVCDNLGFKAIPEVKKSATEQLLSIGDYDQSEDIQNRSAIVTIMGHVDHGKTTLLDTIRKTKVVDKEAGGITQHIGAYKVNTSHGDITFLDTPGHESFTAMRARGAKVTDIVVLVVAANDGVMPQTIEAIQHAAAAKVPIIVAVNKIDKEDADIERIKTDLSQHNLNPEEWGGETIFQNISAKTGQGIDDLIDSIALQAEMLDLKANFAGRPQGTVIESKVDLGLGPTATILVQSGQFIPGTIVLIDEFYGKIRTMYDHTRKKKKAAIPGDTVEITGLSGLPKAGDIALGVYSEKEARLVATQKKSENRLKERLLVQQNKNDLFLKQMDNSVSDNKELSIIIKADVHGSLEAILDLVNKINNDSSLQSFSINVVAYTVGGINSSDIHLASASKALIVAFNVRADASARKLQANELVSIEYFSTVYDLYDYLLQLSKNIMTPETSEKIIGTADVKEVFRTSKQISIAGCIVIEGAIRKNANVRLIRQEKAIYTGKIQSLRRFQDDATEVKKGFECGIGIKGYTDIEPGDQIETFVVEKNIV